MASNELEGSLPDEERFPGERRTTSGRFTGTGGRLVHVAPDGWTRDFGYPLSGLVGLDEARFGLSVDGNVEWPDGRQTRQRYLGDTAAIETVHEMPYGVLVRRDVVEGATHVSHVTVDPADDFTAADLSLAVVATFRPDGRDTRIGQLHFEDAVEIYHASEHDFLAARPGFDEIGGRTKLPPAVRDSDVDVDQIGDHNEEDKLTGKVLGTVPFEDRTASIMTLLTDGTETPRPAARRRIDEVFSTLDGPETIKQMAAGGIPTSSAGSDVDRIAAADLRVLSLLSAESGLRIAGPDFDPEYHYSGGYGYTWFRDDAEIAKYLLAADRRLGLNLEEWHQRSAEQYVASQRSDGSWPHRVWPHSGRLAPGWANARIEDRGSVDYQADQTASVIAFLAEYRAAGFDANGLDATLRNALDSLDATLADDGLPVPCQNAWEDMTGRFTHTAATFLEAYSKLAITDVADGRAIDRARTVYDALDELWVPDRGCYGLRLRENGKLDPRYDSATFALPAAHRAFDEIDGVDGERLDRLVSHVDAVVDGLYRETSAIAGIVRYEGDEWRRCGQRDEKVWTVSTGWAVDACARVAVLLFERDDPRASRFAKRATDLLSLIDLDGSLCAPTSYLPEQLFDDGTPDSATPLGWPHAIRLASASLIGEHDLFTLESAPAND